MCTYNMHMHIYTHKTNPEGVGLTDSRPLRGRESVTENHMYVCRHVCMYVCMRHLEVVNYPMSMSVYMRQECINTHNHIKRSIQVCMYVYIYIHAYIYMYIKTMFKHMHAHIVYTCIYMYIYVYKHTFTAAPSTRTAASLSSEPDPVVQTSV